MPILLQFIQSQKIHKMPKGIKETLSKTSLPNEDKEFLEQLFSQNYGPLIQVINSVQIPQNSPHLEIELQKIINEYDQTIKYERQSLFFEPNPLKVQEKQKKQSQRQSQMFQQNFNSNSKMRFSFLDSIAKTQESEILEDETLQSQMQSNIFGNKRIAESIEFQQEDKQEDNTNKLLLQETTQKQVLSAQVQITLDAIQFENSQNIEKKKTLILQDSEDQTVESNFYKNNQINKYSVDFQFFQNIKKELKFNEIGFEFRTFVEDLFEDSLDVTVSRRFFCLKLEVKQLNQGLFIKKKNKK